MLDSLIGPYFPDWSFFPYLLIFVGMLIEGNVTMLVVGFLISAGRHNPAALIVVALAGSGAESYLAPYQICLRGSSRRGCESRSNWHTR